MQVITLKQAQSKTQFDRPFKIDLGQQSWLTLVPNAVGASEQDLAALWRLRPDQQDKIVVFGREHLVPRYQQLFGEGIVYRYSNQLMYAQAIQLPWLQALLDQVNAWESRWHYNGVLVNWYEHGAHGMGSHADDESDLYANAPIFSVSLGGERVFRIRRRNQQRVLDLNLAHGTLLVMGGQMQSHFKHEVPKTKKQVAPRINLTFRAFTPLSRLTPDSR